MHPGFSDPGPRNPLFPRAARADLKDPEDFGLRKVTRFPEVTCNESRRAHSGIKREIRRLMELMKGPQKVDFSDKESRLRRIFPMKSHTIRRLVVSIPENPGKQNSF